MGKIIYEARNKAAEYGKYAFSAYHSCSNGCTYCYLRKGVFAKTMGGDLPKLKACFEDENHALKVFEKELVRNIYELQKHGLFFSFTTDPMLPKTDLLTRAAIDLCVEHRVFVKVLTKRAETPIRCSIVLFDGWKKYVAFGFTLTGHDELEPHASTNAERIEAMRKLHEAGFKTWASIEPVIDIKSSVEMIEQTYEFCNLYKIGIESGKKYDKKDLQLFIGYVTTDLDVPFPHVRKGNKFYFKDSLLAQAGISRSELPDNCVSNDYDMFNS